MDFSYDKNVFRTENKRITFKYNISEVFELSDENVYIIICYPSHPVGNSYDGTNDIANIFAVSYSGELLWQVEDRKQHKNYNKQRHLNFVGIFTQYTPVIAVDYFGNRYNLDINNGKLTFFDFVK